MNDLEFSFEESPWEQYFSRLQECEVVDAATMLTLLEGEEEEIFEEAFRMMEENDHWLDISDLPRPAFTGENGTRLRYEADWVKKGARVDKLEETDPLRLYLEELAGIPVHGDITLLADQLARANREGENADSVRMQLVNLLLSRVVEEAGAHTGRGVLLLDLIQEGSIGLWKATDVFIGRGADFELVSSLWIREYMNRAVLMQARAGGVGQKMRTALEDYRAVDERLLSELGEEEPLYFNDYKTALQELVQREEGRVLSYHLAGESGPDHNKTFAFEVLINGCVVGRGSGHSKKEAEQAAARDALSNMEK